MKWPLTILLCVAMLAGAIVYHANHSGPVTPPTPPAVDALRNAAAAYVPGLIKIHRDAQGLIADGTLKGKNVTVEWMAGQKSSLAKALGLPLDEIWNENIDKDGNWVVPDKAAAPLGKIADAMEGVK